MKTCEHCGKDCAKRVPVMIKGKVSMVGIGCSKKFKIARRSDLAMSLFKSEDMISDGVIILSGIPGSGKSSYVKRYIDAGLVTRSSVCSADDYFMKSGKYVFNPSKLGVAHAECLRKFIEACQSYENNMLGGYYITGGGIAAIVDNTNTSVLEIGPYYSVAKAYDLDVTLVTLKCDPSVCAARNTHGVPLVGCERMAAAIASRSIPPYWDLKTRTIDCP